MDRITSVLQARSIVVCFCGLFLIQSACSYKIFQKRIPNGPNVPNPCSSGVFWNGVGHKNSMGGGVRNPFGKDFEENGKVWNKTLCKKDSDGDGRTNGQELGDPECTWSEGKIPNITTGITHPGICEDINSDYCKTKNAWLNCGADKFKCDDVHHEAVKNFTVHLPKSDVPTKETTYMCMTFKFPSDGDYHIIAEEPIIDNDNVLHHMLLFGCKNLERKSKDGQITYSSPLNTPFKCNMIPSSKCQEILGLWSFGSPGHCGSSHAGFRIGNKGYRYGAIQVHWNNPEKRADFTDSSGFLLHYTPELRPYDAGILTIGQMHLEIPPQRAEYEVTATCSKECSAVTMDSDLYIIEGFNHMHYLGKSEKVDLYRQEEKIIEITNEPIFSYDNPKSVFYDKPIAVKPGDELRTTCTFQSLKANKTTYFGEDTSSEMCFAFLTFYPKQKLSDSLCVSWKSIPYCVMNKRYRAHVQEINGCNLTTFDMGSIMKMFVKVMSSCNPYTCNSKCLPVVKEFLLDPCFQGDLFDMQKDLAYRYYKHMADPAFKSLDPCLSFLKACPNCTIEDTTIEVNASSNESTSIGNGSFSGTISTPNILDNGTHYSSSDSITTTPDISSGTKYTTFSHDSTVLDDKENETQDGISSDGYTIGETVTTTLMSAGRKIIQDKCFIFLFAPIFAFIFSF